VIGEVTALADAPVEEGTPLVHGAKGVEGGTVQVVGEHPLA
jgi:phosphoribosylformylglycinamidine cyclo-ligase